MYLFKLATIANESVQHTVHWHLHKAQWPDTDGTKPIVFQKEQVFTRLDTLSCCNITLSKPNAYIYAVRTFSSPFQFYLLWSVVCHFLRPRSSTSATVYPWYEATWTRGSSWKKKTTNHVRKIVFVDRPLLTWHRINCPLGCCHRSNNGLN